MKTAAFVGLLGVATVVTGFHSPQCLGMARPPVARHVASFASTDAASVAHNVSVSCASKKRSKRGGRHRRRSSTAGSKVKVVEPLSTHSTRAMSRPPETRRERSPLKLPVSMRNPSKLAESVLKPITIVLDPWKSRLHLREFWRRHAGILCGGFADGELVDYSIVRCRNDFELVTRAGKEIEHLLEAYFEAPRGKGVALPVKMRLARTADGGPLSLGLQKRMKHLIKTRNALVHKRDVHAIRHRRAFRDGLKKVLRELAAEADRIQLQRQAIKVPPAARNSESVTRVATGSGTGAQVLAVRLRVHEAQFPDGTPSDEVYRA